MADDHLDVCIGFHRDDPLGLANEIAQGLQRGDFISFKQRCRARLVLWTDAAAKYPPPPEERQARAAEHAAAAAYLAVGVSLLWLIVAYMAYVMFPAGSISHTQTSRDALLGR